MRENPSVQEGSLYSTPCVAFIICRFFSDGPSDHCEVVSHCSFDLHFSNNQQCCVPFHVLVGHLYVFFGSYLFQIGELFSSAHFLIELLGCLLLSFMICLYILEINPLSVALFANIFSNFICCFFHFVYSFLLYKTCKFNQGPLLFNLWHLILILGDQCQNRIALQYFIHL